jgi:hypothetical protein
MWLQIAQQVDTAVKAALPLRDAIWFAGGGVAFFILKETFSFIKWSKDRKSNGKGNGHDHAPHETESALAYSKVLAVDVNVIKCKEMLIVHEAELDKLIEVGKVNSGILTQVTALAQVQQGTVDKLINHLASKD